MSNVTYKTPHITAPQQNRTRFRSLYGKHKLAVHTLNIKTHGWPSSWEVELSVFPQMRNRSLVKPTCPIPSLARGCVGHHWPLPFPQLLSCQERSGTPAGSDQGSRLHNVALEDFWDWNVLQMNQQFLPPPCWDGICLPRGKAAGFLITWWSRPNSDSGCSHWR